MYSTVIIHGWEKEAIDSRGSRCSIPPHLLLYVYIVSLPFLILIASCTRQLKALWSSSLSLFLILFLILFPPFLCVIQSNLSASSGKLVSKRKCVLTFISSRRKKKRKKVVVVVVEGRAFETWRMEKKKQKLLFSSEVVTYRLCVWRWWENVAS
jgi:hypothetical protein